MKQKPIHNYISAKERRYEYIDAVRGLAVVGMIAYHFLFDVFYLYGLDPDFYFDPQFALLQRVVSFSFFIVSGASLNFSSKPIQNGILLNLCGLGVTLVTLAFLPEAPILYGVLTCLGISMIIAGLMKKPLSKLNPVAAMTVTLILFVFTYGIQDGFIGVISTPLIRLPSWLYGSRYLALIGLPHYGFFSSDYYPMVPWVFLFLFGFFLWRFIKGHGFDGNFRSRVPVLGFIGRHSLIIYLAHQVALYGLCMLIFGY
ncbi:MAG: DUF1624 domain-containing protein [Clostridia bacterium]|nr:DUF1624 domain-containing protein [Clostridia bacterium]